MRSRLIVLGCAAFVFVVHAAADPSAGAVPSSSAGAAPPGATSDAAALVATTRKFDSYVVFMNRTLRAVDSLARYRS